MANFTDWKIALGRLL